MKKRIEVTRDKVYTAAQNEEWNKVIDFLRWSKEDVKKDALLKNAFDNTINGFFASNWEDIDTRRLVEALRIIHEFKDKYLTITESQFKELVKFLVVHFQEIDLKLAYHYAQSLPQLNCSKKVVEEYKESERQEILHRKSDKVKVDENVRTASSKHTRSLFKSKQEKDFFNALRNIFQMYTVYPNVAVSTVIEFDSIKSKLSSQEKSYFFKSVIDTVVIDHSNNYEPIYFFELDSHYHFNDEQKRKDNMKDKILRKAGCKLYRIMKQEDEVGIEDFETAIKDVLDK